MHLLLHWFTVYFRFFAVMPPRRKFHRVPHKGYSKTESAKAKPVKVPDQIESNDTKNRLSMMWVRIDNKIKVAIICLSYWFDDIKFIAMDCILLV